MSEEYILIQRSTLENIADTIRAKTGITESIRIGDINTDNEEIMSRVKLTDLENEGTASDLLAGKELISQEGGVVTGTFTIDNELTTQDDLIAQIQTALEGKAAGGDSGSSGETINTCNITINSFNTIQCLSYTAYENNNVVVKLFTSGATTVEITNVICGSSISFCNFYDFNGFTHSHDSRVIGHYTAYMWALSAPTTPNINATISIYDDD